MEQQPSGNPNANLPSAPTNGGTLYRAVNNGGHVYFEQVSNSQSTPIVGTYYQPTPRRLSTDADYVTINAVQSTTVVRIPAGTSIFRVKAEDDKYRYYQAITDSSGTRFFPISNNSQRPAHIQPHPQFQHDDQTHDYSIASNPNTQLRSHQMRRMSAPSLRNYSTDEVPQPVQGPATSMTQVVMNAALNTAQAFQTNTQTVAHQPNVVTNLNVAQHSAPIYQEERHSNSNRLPSLMSIRPGQNPAYTGISAPIHQMNMLRSSNAHLLQSHRSPAVNIMNAISGNVSGNARSFWQSLLNKGMSETEARNAPVPSSHLQGQPSSNETTTNRAMMQQRQLQTQMTEYRDKVSANQPSLAANASSIIGQPYGHKADLTAQMMQEHNAHRVTSQGHVTGNAEDQAVQRISDDSPGDVMRNQLIQYGQTRQSLNQQQENSVKNIEHDQTRQLKNQQQENAMRNHLTQKEQTRQLQSQQQDNSVKSLFKQDQTSQSTCHEQENAMINHLIQDDKIWQSINQQQESARRYRLFQQQVTKQSLNQHQQNATSTLRNHPTQQEPQQKNATRNHPVQLVPRGQLPNQPENSASTNPIQQELARQSVGQENALRNHLTQQEQTRRLLNQHQENAMRNQPAPHIPAIQCLGQPNNTPTHQPTHPGTVPPENSTLETSWLVKQLLRNFLQSYQPPTNVQEFGRLSPGLDHDTNIARPGGGQNLQNLAPGIERKTLNGAQRVVGPTEQNSTMAPSAQEMGVPSAVRTLQTRAEIHQQSINTQQNAGPRKIRQVPSNGTIVNAEGTLSTATQNLQPSQPNSYSQENPRQNNIPFKQLYYPSRYQHYERTYHHCQNQYPVHRMEIPEKPVDLRKLYTKPCVFIDDVDVEQYPNPQLKEIERAVEWVGEDKSFNPRNMKKMTDDWDVWIPPSASWDSECLLPGYKPSNNVDGESYYRFVSRAPDPTDEKDSGTEQLSPQQKELWNAAWVRYHILPGPEQPYARPYNHGLSCANFMPLNSENYQSSRDCVFPQLDGTDFSSSVTQDCNENGIVGEVRREEERLPMQEDGQRAPTLPDPEIVADGNEERVPSYLRYNYNYYHNATFAQWRSNSDQFEIERTVVSGTDDEEDEVGEGQMSDEEEEVGLRAEGGRGGGRNGVGGVFGTTSAGGRKNSHGLCKPKLDIAPVAHFGHHYNITVRG